jgi:hypothetical protein
MEPFWFTALQEETATVRETASDLIGRARTLCAEAQATARESRRLQAIAGSLRRGRESDGPNGSAAH